MRRNQFDGCAVRVLKMLSHIENVRELDFSWTTIDLPTSRRRVRKVGLICDLDKTNAFSCLGQTSYIS